MDKIFVFWSDWEGTYCDVFPSREEASMKVGDIVAKVDSTDDHGTQLSAVVEGVELAVSIVSRIDVVELIEKEVNEDEDEESDA